jgi:hypothetical protein
MKLPSGLHAFVALLNAARVKYVVVGGYAVAYHGHPRFTGDIDIFVDHTRDNGAKIVAALEEFGFGELDIKASDFCQNDLVLQLGNPPNRIDVMTSIDGVTFDEAWATGINAIVDEFPICFINRKLLIKNKRAAAKILPTQRNSRKEESNDEYQQFKR